MFCVMSPMVTPTKSPGSGQNSCLLIQWPTPIPKRNYFSKDDLRFLNHTGHRGLWSLRVCWRGCHVNVNTVIYMAFLASLNNSLHHTHPYSIFLIRSKRAAGTRDRRPSLQDDACSPSLWGAGTSCHFPAHFLSCPFLLHQVNSATAPCCWVPLLCSCALYSALPGVPLPHPSPHSSALSQVSPFIPKASAQDDQLQESLLGCPSFRRGPMSVLAALRTQCTWFSHNMSLQNDSSLGVQPLQPGNS